MEEISPETGGFCISLKYVSERRHAVKHGCRAEFLEGNASDAPGRNIDCPAKRLFVVRIDHQTEVRHQVLHLGSFIKGKAPVYLVRNVSFSEGFFQYPGLCIGAVKNGKIAVTGSRGIHFTQNGRHYLESFLGICISIEQLYFFTRFGLCKTFLAHPARVVADQAVCRLDHCLRGPVVLFQPVFLGFRKIFTEIQDIFNAGTPECINALRIIAHNRNVAVHQRQVLDDQVLCQVGVLVLIYQYIPEFLPVFCQHFRILLKKNVGIKQQIIKIHGTGYLAFFCIQCVDVRYARFTGCLVCLHQLVIGSIGGRCHQAVLGFGYAGHDFRRRIRLVIQFQIFYTTFNSRFAVRFVINSERFRESQHLSFLTQDTCKHRVERSHPQITHFFRSGQGRHTFFHFLGRLVGKGKCQYFRGRDSPIQHIGDPAC